MVNVLNRIFKKQHIKEFIKYLTVSCLAIAVDFSVYRGLFAAKIFSRAMSGTISYLIGLFFAYFLLKEYVFKSNIKNKIIYKEIYLYSISGLIGSGITYTSIRLYEDIVSADSHSAKIAAMGLSFFIVFLFRKIIVFKK